MLGRRTGHEKPFDPFRTKEPEAPATVSDREGNIRRLPEPAARPERVDRDRRKLEAAIAGVAGDVRRGLEEIRSADPKFDPVDFVGGARVAFEMIVGAFAQGDAKALRPLLRRPGVRQLRRRDRGAQPQQASATRPRWSASSPPTSRGPRSRATKRR